MGNRDSEAWNQGKTLVLVTMLLMVPFTIPGVAQSLSTSTADPVAYDQEATQTTQTDREKKPLTVPFTEEFGQGLNNWNIDLHPNAGDRVTKGSGEWTSEYSGSVHLSVDGGPNHVGVYRPVNGLEEGTVIRVEYESPNLDGSPGGPRILLHLPNGEESLKLDHDPGEREHNGTLVGTVPRDLPDGTELEVRLGVWPGEIDTYVTSITVEEPEQTGDSDQTDSTADTAGSDDSSDADSTEETDSNDQESDDSDEQNAGDGADGADSTGEDNNDSDDSAVEQPLEESVDADDGDQGNSEETSNDDRSAEQSPEVTVEENTCEIVNGEYQHRYRVSVSPSDYEFYVIGTIRNAETGAVITDIPSTETTGQLEFVETTSETEQPAVIDLTVVGDGNDGILREVEAPEECSELANEQQTSDDESDNNADSEAGTGGTDSGSDSRSDTDSDSGGPPVDSGPDVDEEFQEAAREAAIENREKYAEARETLLNRFFWYDAGGEAFRNSLEAFVPSYSDVTLEVLARAAGTDSVGTGLAIKDGIEAGLYLRQGLHYTNIGDLLYDTRNEDVKTLYEMLEENSRKIDEQQDVTHDNEFTNADREILYSERKRYLEMAYRSLVIAERESLDYWSPLDLSNPNIRQEAYTEFRYTLEVQRQILYADYQATTSWLQNSPANTTLPEAADYQFPNRDVNSVDKADIDTIETPDDYGLYRIDHDQNHAEFKNLEIRVEDYGGENLHLYVAEERIDPENPMAAQGIQHASTGGTGNAEAWISRNLEPGETYYVLVTSDTLTTYRLFATTRLNYHVPYTEADIDPEFIDNRSYPSQYNNQQPQIATHPQMNQDMLSFDLISSESKTDWSQATAKSIQRVRERG